MVYAASAAGHILWLALTVMVSSAFILVPIAITMVAAVRQATAGA